VQTEELFSKRVVCLDRRRKDLRALTQVFAEADGTVVEKAVSAAGALPDLRECQDVDVLSSEVVLPSDPARRKDIDELGTKLAEVKARHDAGKYQAALELLRQVEPRVGATGHRPLMAETHYWLGWVEFLLAEKDAGIPSLERAFNEAEAGRADRMKVRVLTKLIYVEGTRKHWDVAERWGGIARASLDRIGNDELSTFGVLANLGTMEFLRERYPEARVFLDKSRELQDRLFPSWNPNRFMVPSNLAIVLGYLGEQERAKELSREVVRQADVSLGRDHPDVARYRFVYAQNLHLVGDELGALEQVEEALRVWRLSLGPRHPKVADALNDAGRYELALGRNEEARRSFEAALEIQHEVLSPDDEDLQYTYDNLGQALLAEGRTSEAIAAFEKALSFTGARAESLAESNFGLARALWVTGRPAQGRVQALRARERFVQASAKAEAAKVDAWLTAHPEAGAQQRR